MAKQADVTTPETRAVAKALLEKVLRELLTADVMKGASGTERKASLIHYLAGRFSLDRILVARFCGETIFTQHFEGQAPKEETQALLIAANQDDEAVFKFLLYANVGDELITGGSAAPACTLKRVA
jgi:hypothetical protein